MTLANPAKKSIEDEAMSLGIEPAGCMATERGSASSVKNAKMAYAIGQLRSVRLNDGIVAYLRGIDATLEPFGGRFIIHGGKKEVMEGAPSDDLIVISFPTMEAARSWYASPAYQALIGLRTQGAEGDVFLIQGADATQRATDILQ